ncbi:MAG: transposase, partial [Rubrivivax sp.]
FRWKDYRVKEGAAVGASGQTRYKAMTLAPEEFMRRFLLHVLPGGFHRIRHYGLLANGSRKASLALARELLSAPKPEPAASNDENAGIKPPTFVCRHCGRALLIVQTFTRGQSIRAPPQPGQ